MENAFVKFEKDHPGICVCMEVGHFYPDRLRVWITGIGMTTGVHRDLSIKELYDLDNPEDTMLSELNSLYEEFEEWVKNEGHIL